MQRQVLYASTLFIFILLPYVRSCSSNSGTTVGPTGTALQRKMGNRIRQVGNVPDLVDGKSVTSASQLTCSSRNRADCCWRQNREAPIDWVAASGTADRNLMQRHFQQSPPTGVGFLASYANTARSGENAVLESCVINCVNGPIDFAIESWLSDTTALEVCVSPKDFLLPQNCQFLRKGMNNVLLQPLGEPMRLIVRASQFDAPDGSVVAVDDLTVNADISDNPSCDSGPGPGPSPTELCTKTTCDFNSGSQCSYRALTGGNDWIVTTERVGNPNTGVREPLDGQYFAGTEVQPKQTVILESEPLNVDQPLELQFKAYEATSDMQLKACINDMFNCPWESDRKVLASDLQWQQASIPIDQSTRKILFVAENKGDQHGAAGVDDIKLFTASGTEVTC